MWVCVFIYSIEIDNANNACTATLLIAVSVFVVVSVCLDVLVEVVAPAEVLVADVAGERFLADVQRPDVSL